MRKLIIVAIAAALAATACVPAAMAAKTKTTVKLTSAFLGNGQSFWDGTIKSSKKACANKRSVTVYTGAGKKIGTVKSHRVTGVVGYQMDPRGSDRHQAWQAVLRQGQGDALVRRSQVEHVHVQERAPAAPRGSRAALGQRRVVGGIAT